MAFEQKDTTTAVQVQRAEGVEEIIFRRNREIPAPGLEIVVVKKVDVNGEAQRVSKRVPQNLVTGAWPGQARTLEAHLLMIIDNAV